MILYLELWETEPSVSGVRLDKLRLMEHSGVGLNWEIENAEQGLLTTISDLQSNLYIRKCHFQSLAQITGLLTTMVSFP